MSKHELDTLYTDVGSDAWQGSPSVRQDWAIAARQIGILDPGSSVLDVGCFDGQFLNFLGGRFERSGVEINPEAARRAAVKGIRIVGADLACLRDVRSRYDAVVAMDVIEHVPDPKAFLLTLAQAAKPGGMIIISTGNADSWPWRAMGGRYWYCWVPEHISFISIRWCTSAAKELNLTISHTERFAHTVASLPRAALHALANALWLVSPRLAVGAKKTLKRVLAKPSGPTDELPPPLLAAKDHMLVVLRKPHFVATQTANAFDFGTHEPARVASL